ncbi:Retrotransposable element [Phytophthora palmivora]|uniref:Retrotransposable element n=1 Tax=Phytophthora palmivora TaxID=4796 RepID=A0A2P4YLK6_9STRA|nr:Retrotransposable element [Phytophthora palmivora]
MNVTSSKDAKKRYLTYSIVVRPANAANGTQEETVTKKMAKFIDGGPKDFLEWVYHFKQLAMAKNWNAEDKFLNTALLLESDLHDAFDDAAITDDDVRMEEEFWRILYSASKVVLPVDCSEKLQEELWEIKKVRSESLAKCSKRFRALARMEKTLAKLSENPAMCEDALFRLFKRGFLTNGRTKMMPVGKYIQLLLLCCLNISKRYCMLPEIVFQFKRLPMGISTASDEYQECMEKILGDLPFVIVYLDDILVFSESEVDHLEHLRIVFKRLREYDVTLNASKYRILRESVDYLGFTLTPTGIQPQAKKVEAIQQIAEPRNKKELRRFLE